jgi:hypothetical protein
MGDEQVAVGERSLARKPFASGQVAESGDRAGEAQERPIFAVPGLFEFPANDPAAWHTRFSRRLRKPFRQIIGKSDRK